jgi:hypothetical protein
MSRSTQDSNQTISTVTVFSNTIEVRIPTGLSDKRTVNVAPVPAQAAATTISPSVTPTYASYFSACSCAGVTASTTTLTTPVTTVTEEPGACFVKRAVKRAGEAMGYEFDERWDDHDLPGIKLF